MMSFEKARLYSEFLAHYCGCYEDEVGNRPCDNGALCDRCHTKEAQELWEQIKKDNDL